MREDLIARADDAFVRAYRKSELCHNERDADRAGDDGFAAAVRAGQHVDHALVVEGEIVRDHRRVELAGDDGIAQRLCREFFLCHRCDHRRGEMTALIAQTKKQVGGLCDKLDLRHHPNEEIGVFQHVHLDDLFPRPDGGAEHIVDRSVEGVGECQLLIVRLSLAKRDQRRDAGHFIRFEVEPEHFVEQLARFERLVVHREHTGLFRAQLRIQIYADGDRFDLAHPGGQLRQPFVQIAVILTGGQHVDPLGKPFERGAAEMRRKRQEVAFQQVQERGVQLYLGDAI